MKRRDLLFAMADLSKPDFDLLVAYLRAPRSILSPPNTPVATRAAELMDWMDQNGLHERAAEFIETIQERNDVAAAGDDDEEDEDEEDEYQEEDDV